MDYKISYWRTKTGFEVDFVIHLKTGLPIPIEVKTSSNVHNTELKGLRVFMKDEIMIYPVRDFLEKL